MAAASKHDKEMGGSASFAGGRAGSVGRWENVEKTELFGMEEG